MTNDPTNSHIMKTLGRIEEKVDENVTLGKKTNGRVTKLEIWRAQREAIENYKATTVVKTEGKVVVNKSVLFTEGGQKMLLAIAGIITVAATVILARFA